MGSYQSVSTDKQTNKLYKLYIMKGKEEDEERNENICLQTIKQILNSNTETTLILSGSSTDTRGSWPKTKNCNFRLFLEETK